MTRTVVQRGPNNCLGDMYFEFIGRLLLGYGEFELLNHLVCVQTPRFHSGPDTPKFSKSEVVDGQAELKQWEQNINRFVGLITVLNYDGAQFLKLFNDIMKVQNTVIKLEMLLKLNVPMIVSTLEKEFPIS